ASSERGFTWCAPADPSNSTQRLVSPAGSKRSTIRSAETGHQPDRHGSSRAATGRQLLHLLSRRQKSRRPTAATWGSHRAVAGAIVGNAEKSGEVAGQFLSSAP